HDARPIYPRTTHHLDRHVGRPQVEGRGIDRHSGMPEIDAERLAYPPGPRAEQPRRIHATARVHGIEAMERLDRPDQHPGPMALFAADDVEAPVDAVGAIHVYPARWAEHRRVALRASAEGMRSRIIAIIGLDLHDPPADALE